MMIAKSRMSEEQEKVRIELNAEIVCLTCKTFFTIHDFGKHMLHEAGAGYHISGIGCPNCKSKDLDFDIMSVAKTGGNSSQAVIEFRLKERNGMVPLPVLLAEKATTAGAGAGAASKMKRKTERKKKRKSKSKSSSNKKKSELEYKLSKIKNKKYGLDKNKKIPKSRQLPESDWNNLAEYEKMQAEINRALESKRHLPKNGNNVQKEEIVQEEQEQKTNNNNTT
jgi:hypothetical protein